MRGGASHARGARAPGRAPRWVVIADDLTGAADSAVWLSGRSGPATLVLDAAADWPAEGPVAIDTETRHAEEDVAKLRVAAVAERARRSGAMLYKKVDSLGRGNLASELGAMLAVLRHDAPRAIAVLAPAFPSVGRATLSGVIHADGRPVLRQGRPLDLTELLRRSGLAPGRATAPRTVSEMTSQLVAAADDHLDVLVVDASTDHHLEVIATAAAPGENVLLVGSGGLARHLDGVTPRSGGRHLPAEPRNGATLFVVGSRSTQAEAQRAALVAAGVIPVPVHPLEGSGEIRAARRHLDEGRDVALFPDAGMPVIPEHAHRVAHLLSEAAAPLLEAASTLVLTGGETAHAVLQRGGVSALRVLGEIEPGVVLSRAAGLNPHVVTKAGSFGDDGVLVRLLRHPTTRSSTCPGQ